MGITIQHAQRTALAVAEHMLKSGFLYRVMPDESELNNDDEAETLESIAHLAVYGEDIVLEYSGEEAEKIVLDSLAYTFPEYAA